MHYLNSLDLILMMNLLNFISPFLLILLNDIVNEILMIVC